MKLIYAFTICLIIVQFSNAQSTYQVDIKRDKDINFIRSLPMKNGDCLIGAYDFYSNSQTTLRFVRLKTNGDIAWSKYFSVPDFNSYNVCFAATKDNGFIAVARLDSGKRYGIALEMFKCDSGGNIEWQKKIVPDSKSAIFPTKIIQKKDGDYYFVYDENKFTALANFNLKGNLVWLKTFDATTSDYGYSVTNLQESEDGGALLAVSTISCEYYCIHFDLYKFKENGNPETLLTFNPDFSFSSEVSYVNQDLTGKYKILLKGSTSNSFYGRYYYITVEPDNKQGNVLISSDNIFSLQYLIRTDKIPGARKLFTSPNGFLEKYRYFNNDLSINISSAHYDENNVESIHAEKYDSLGRICPSFILPEIDSTLKESKFSLYQGVFLLKNGTGFSFQNSILQSKNVGDITLICANAPSEITRLDAKNLSNSLQNKHALTAFPNPAHNFINVRINRKDNFLASLEIVSVDESIHRKYAVNINKQFEQKLNISDLPKGIYILKLNGDDYTEFFKFLKE